VKSQRVMAGVTIVVAWLGGLAFLVHREYFRPQIERLAEAATRVAPGAVYYGVLQGNRQVGFASSTIDTAETSIGITDYLVADLPIGGKARRTSARTNVTLTRTFHLIRFNITINAEGPPLRAAGRVDGDSVMTVGVFSGTERVDSQRVALMGPVLLPTLVPLAISLTERPKLGKHYAFPVFDPTTRTSRDVALDVHAESLFVVSDSAVFDSASARWRGVQPDTLRAWHVTSPTAGGFAGWIDEQGRIVETTQLGFELRRMPYEVAFENWRADSTRGTVTDDRDILETTAIAANVRMAKRVSALKLRLSGVSLVGFDVNGPAQRLAKDTVFVSSASDSALMTTKRLPYRRSRDDVSSDPEPLLQSDNRDIIRLARQIQRGERDPRVVAERLNTWVHDSIAARITFGVPNALQVLKTRVGDCNEHTQLFVALARAVGLPARVAAGLAYVDGKFYYHAWPEVFLDDWVAVDPTFGQFPADAAHLRFIVGGLARQTELLRLMGNLKIDVLSVNGAAARPAFRAGK
jgi:hypothetical protein